MGKTMKKILMALISAAFAMPALAELEAGDTAPKFEARASLAGEPFDYSLANALEDGPVVVYFYPSAYTRGCNIQAHEFAVNMDKFNEAGATVIGVSLDNIDRLNDFSADPEYCAGKLAVASDESAEIANAVLGRTDLVGAQRLIYVLNLTEPNGMFQARDFVIRDDDTVYVTEAPYVQWTKVITALTGTLGAADSLASAGSAVGLLGTP